MAPCHAATTAPTLPQIYMGIVDLIVFFGFIAAVIYIGLWQSSQAKKAAEAAGGGKGAEDYFLAGRGLTWWLVGFSLIAANISTEQFVGMSGKASDWLGMAIASYEWMAAVTLVIVAFFFLPTFLKLGLYTIPEFLEHRYGTISRLVMTVATLVVLVGVPTASVVYSGATVVTVAFQELGVLGNLVFVSWAIGILAAVYVFVGGLRAVAWTDLIQGSALILGGLIVAYLAINALGSADPVELAKTATTPGVTPEQLQNAGWLERFQILNGGAASEGGKLHMVRPLDDPEIPWSALLVGLWIPNFFYWGLNQYIMQRTLGSKSLAEGQKGVVFAAFLKLIIPFVVVIPGILAFNLFSDDLKSEADKQNAPIVEKFEAGESLVYPFSMEFAEVNPELARRIFIHNAGLAGEEFNLTSIVSPESLADENQKFVDAAADNDIEEATKLVGYHFDAAFPTLLRNLLEPGSGVKGFVFAAIFGAVISTLASMLNAASTLVAMDLVRKANPNASQRTFVLTGRVCVIAFVIIACLIAPGLANPAFGGIFTFIQEFQGFISPGILAVALFGLFVKKAPKYCGWLGIGLNAILYGLLKFFLGDLIAGNGLWYADEMAFLDRMSICFGIVLLVLAIVTILNPLKEPVKMPENKEFDMTSSKGAKFAGVGIIILTAILYIIFW